MSVSSVSSSSDLQSILKQFKSQRASGSDRADDTATADAKRPEDAMAEALKNQGLDDESISKIQSQIRSAMEEHKAEGQGGMPSEDGMRSSIDSILQQNGVNTDAFNTYMQQNMAHPSMGGSAHRMSPMGINTANDGGVDLYA